MQIVWTADARQIPFVVDGVSVEVDVNELDVVDVPELVALSLIAERLALPVRPPRAPVPSKPRRTNPPRTTTKETDVHG